MATDGCSIIGILMFSTIVGVILEVHTTIESCFVIIRAIDDLFIMCNLRAKVCHEKQIFVMEG